MNQLLVARIPCAENYEQGVGKYYQQHGSSYRNPHFPGIVAATKHILNVWLESGPLRQRLEEHQAQGGEPSYPSPKTGVDSQASSADQCPPCCTSYTPGNTLRFLDLACGSGEATQAIEQWWEELRTSRNTPSARFGPIILPPPTPALPQDHAPSEAHTAEGATQAQAISTSLSPQAQASEGGGMEIEEGDGGLQGHQQHGEHMQGVSSTLQDQQHREKHTQGGSSSLHRSRKGMDGELRGQLVSRLRLCIDAADPFTGEAYAAWTGRRAEAYSFEDVGSGLLLDEGRSYHLCICSYAMHCCEDSFLFNTLLQLSLVCEALVIISPHKLPRVDERTGWTELEHTVVDRVHARLFVSSRLQSSGDLDLIHNEHQ